MALYDIPIHTLQGADASLGDYAGKTLLLVNVASKCGLTPQYEGLERLQKSTATGASAVIGFPCNQFLGQEPGTAAEIAAVLLDHLRRDLPADGEDRGERRGPPPDLRASSTEKADAEGKAGDITWNFEKFLVSPERRRSWRATAPRSSRRTRPSWATSRPSSPLDSAAPRPGGVRRGHSPRPSSTWTGCWSTPSCSGTRPRSRSSAGSACRCQRTGAARRRGCSSTRSPRHWFGLYPWAGPTPDELAVTIVDRVIELILSKGALKPGAEHAIDLCADAASPWRSRPRREYRLIDAALGHFGLRGRFAVIHSAEEEQYGKPHPAVFLTAASRRRRTAEAAASCGRTRPAGVLAAKAASMACIAVPEPGEGAHPAFGLADLVVDSLLEVDDAALQAVAATYGGGGGGGRP